MAILTRKHLDTLRRRLKVNNITITDTLHGAGTGFTVPTRTKSVYWEYVVQRCDNRGMSAVEAWKYTERNGDGEPYARWNWLVPVPASRTPEQIAAAAAKIRRMQADAEAGIEPDWSMVCDGEKVKKQWNASH
jgi:hypothetical protein